MSPDNIIWNLPNHEQNIIVIQILLLVRVHSKSDLTEYKGTSQAINSS